MHSKEVAMAGIRRDLVLSKTLQLMRKTDPGLTGVRSLCSLWKWFSSRQHCVAERLYAPHTSTDAPADSS